ncbi:MAG: hypothetical protein WCE75_03905 [Terracidiphilus sp.]
MPSESEPARDNLTTGAPVAAEAAYFSRKVRGLLDGAPKDDATVAETAARGNEVLDQIAAGLYSIASMLVGEGEESVRLVEAAVANAEVSACADPARVRRNSRRSLGVAAVELLAKRDPAALAAPEGLDPDSSCIDDDDLASTGISTEELEEMIAGPNRERVRGWLEGLPATLRTIFVLRAVAGIPAPETAELLAKHGGPRAAGWSTEAVRVVFRQGLCSLASQLIHASAGK